MRMLSGFQKLLFASFALLSISVGTASAEPAPLTVRNQTGQNITLSVIWTHSCTQGTDWGATLQVSANSSTVWQLGRNSAVSGCTGQVCAEVSPVSDERNIICFNIYGGNPIGMIGDMPRSEYRADHWRIYPNFQFIAADQNRSAFENWLTIGGSN